MNESIVHIVDDEAGFCEVLSVLVESIGLNVRTYGRADEFLKNYDPSIPGCLILDVRIPDINGVTLFEVLNQRNIRIPTIFITSHATVSLAVRIMKMGAFDFIEKPFDNDLMLERIQQAVLKDRQEREYQDKIRDYTLRVESLSKRERQILDGVIAGKNNKIIGLEHRISHKTVEFHRMNIMRKLGADTLVQLARVVMLVSGADSGQITSDTLRSLSKSIQNTNLHVFHHENHNSLFSLQ
jgi:FixJ family two-component response regulator